LELVYPGKYVPSAGAFDTSLGPSQKMCYSKSVTDFCTWATEWNLMSVDRWSRRFFCS